MAINASLRGVQQRHYNNATRILDELRITDARHWQTILASAAHVAEVNRYNYDLKTGKIKAARNPRGLPRLGRRQSAQTYPRLTPPYLWPARLLLAGRH